MIIFGEEGSQMHSSCFIYRKFFQKYESIQISIFYNLSWKNIQLFEIIISLVLFNIHLQ